MTAPKKEPMKVFIVKTGQTLAGGDCYWLDLDDDELDYIEELVKSGDLPSDFAEREEDDRHVAGFFHTREEAVTSAKARGWEVTNE